MLTPPHALAASLRYRANTWIGERPRLAVSLYRRSARKRRFLVTPETELVIEAFPRSGSTYVWYAFMVAQGRACAVATHAHVPAQVLLAIDLGIPTLVLLRDPEAAVRSFLLREPHLAVNAMLDRYLSFYRVIAAQRHRIVLADFACAMSDVAGVIDRINAHYATSFWRLEPSPGNSDRINQLLDARHRAIGGGALTSYRPNAEKARAKDAIGLAPYSAKLAACKELYAELVACLPGRDASR
ncbi:hypothetical protein CKO31_05420 [Thiohalocapsa halophila]|uniref:Sulfotransferase family protein n=1 Tax=Thiohalocapsa halophila TaxID=69359 RepID=A0ABS1CFM6_9GAMM|nr:hypothetical protein [Thiohalocapsa halophila]MBK1630191.1 hypothetical protein [Thiohalocapsa halophila]